MMLKRKLARSAIFIIPLILIFSQCIKFKSEDPRGDTYAGSDKCVSCHRNISSSFLHTAHYIAAQPSAGNNIQGSFKRGSNEFIFNPHLKVIMDKRDSGYYQTSYVDNKKEQSQRFDISFGGIKGQTYAYWFTNELFQLPISYIQNAHTWINSPGYSYDHASFERAINVQCLDCHLSYAKQIPPDVPGYYTGAEGFQKTSLIYGVDCERCHGPAAEHVKFQTDNPGFKKAMYIKTYASLSRSQKIDMCAICHSGLNSLKLAAAFNFKPGDSISKYIWTMRGNTVADYTHIDVHGNQKGLLESSKCFQGSGMDCATCHNVHQNQRNNLLLFAGKCLTCHSKTKHNDCKLSNQVPKSFLLNNCVACHMPAFPSKLIIAGTVGALVHTHHIGIYPSESKKIMAMLQH